MPFRVSNRTLASVEWPLLAERLRAHARTPLGRARCGPSAGSGEAADAQEGRRSGAVPGATLFARDEQELRTLLAETGEARSLLDAGELPPLGGVEELDGPLGRLARGGVLPPGELLALASAIRAMAETARFLARRAERAPRLAARAAALPKLDALVSRIHEVLDPEGEVRPEASPVLARARREARRLAGGIEARLARLLRDSRLADALQDRFFTVRGDRYVLPVRSEARGRVPGIVHAASSSGQTVFVEPEGLVELNNALKAAELDAEREAARLVRELSTLATREVEPVRAGLRVLAEIDLAFARGHLSRDLEATEPEVGNEGVFRCLELRHPLLPPDEVVANDIRLGEDFQVLVISGPNAGGKTVAMKALALAALLVRAGMHVPAAPGSRVDVIDGLLADIGDAQDLRQSLSTFSAHLRALARIVESAHPQSLVVLDEVGVGTDPAEGAALAQAVLEALADRGARVVATTHYGLLKEMAAADPRFENASVDFDPETLAPTYRLHLGSAGGSSARVLAARVGLPPAVIERASTLLDGGDREIEDLLAELAASRVALERERAEVARIRSESEQVREAYRERLRRLQGRRDRLFDAMRRELERAFRSAHEEVAAVIRELQRSGGAREAARARERLLAARARAEEETRRAAAPLDAVAAAEPAVEPDEAELDWDRAQVGARVRIRGAGEAVIEALPDRRGRVVVRAGGARLVLPRERLTALAGPDPEPAPAAPPPAPPLREGGTARIDLRGLRVAEALERADAELDRAAARGRDRVVVIHGLGSGALRDAIRRHLEDCPYLVAWRPGGEGEGGDGVTVAELRT